MLKKIVTIFILITALLGFAVVSASDVSLNKMILEWKTSKIWLNNGELCIMGDFTNRRSDLTVTKLNSFIVKIMFNKSDGSKYEFIGSPAKIPLCKVLPNESKRVSFNLGEFTGEWSSWITEQDYTFTYLRNSHW